MALFIKPQTQLKLALNHNWLKPLKNNGKMETLTTLRMASVSERERFMCLFDRKLMGLFATAQNVFTSRSSCHQPWSVHQTNGTNRGKSSTSTYSTPFLCLFVSVSVALFLTHTFAHHFWHYLPFFLVLLLSLSTRSTHSFGTCVFVKLNWNWFLLNVYYSSFCLFVCPYLVGQRINFNVAAIKFCT